MKSKALIWFVLCALLTTGIVCMAEGGTQATGESAVTPLPSALESAIKPETDPEAAAELDAELLGDCTLAVSVEQDGVYRDENGCLWMKVMAYDYDRYDMVDIAALETGDSIVIGGETVEIESIGRDENGAVTINGGLDNGGYELRSDEDTVYYEIGYSDAKSYREMGMATLPLSDAFVFIDDSTPGEEPVQYGAEAFLNGEIAANGGFFFVPGNTSIVVEGGCIVAMNRVYMP